VANRNSISNFHVSIIKGLLKSKKFSNQEIAGLINRDRGSASLDISTGRISNIKNNQIKKYSKIDAADKISTEEFLQRAKKNDLQKRSSLIDERIVRAREAMILAVQLFNSPTIRFKTEVFSVLAIISWTYLLHEYLFRKGVKIVNKSGKSLSLSKMLARKECQLSSGIVNNLEAIVEIRNKVEHHLIGNSDHFWLAKYQACCLNFEKTIVSMFGQDFSLQSELSYALQFSKLHLDQLTESHDHDVPDNIKALSSSLDANLSDSELEDLEYQFKVNYTFTSASKSKSHFKFLNAGDSDLSNEEKIVIKKVPADHDYPLKAKEIEKLVRDRTGKDFNNKDFWKAYRLYKIRPRQGAKQPENTNKDYCLYSKINNNYSYSEAYVDFLVEKILDAKEFEKIRSLPNR